MTDIENNVPILQPRTHFTKINNRQVATGSFSTNALLEHLQNHFKHKNYHKRWCNPECAAKAFHMRVTPDNKRTMRRRFYNLSLECLSRNKYLLKIHRGKHGELQEIKLFDPESEQDKAYAWTQYQKEKDKGELTTERLQKVVEIISSESHSTSDTTANVA